MAKKNKRYGARLAAVGMSWSRALTICAHDVGFSGGSVKAGVIAMALCEKYAEPFTTKDEVICRHAARLAPMAAAQRVAEAAKRAMLAGEHARRLNRPQPGRPPQFTGDVTSDAFLLTYQWKRLRMEALKKYGAKCMCCGASPKDGAVMNVDHIRPRKLFPALALNLDNLQILCGDCNHGKGNWDMTDWREQADQVFPVIGK